MTDDVKPDEGAVKADPKATDAKAAKPAAPEAEGKESAGQAPDDGGNDTDKPKKPHWSQKRIDELTKNWRQEQREKAALMDLLNRQQPPQPAAQPQAQAANKPTADKFPNYEEFLEALADWKADQKWESRERQRREQTEKQAQEQSRKKILDTFAERTQKAIEKYDDFEDVAYHQAPINEVMAEVIRRSELGPEIAYFLGKNPDKGQQIAAMQDPHSVALALGRIEAQLEAAATPPPAVTPSAPKAAPTAAPPPPKTLSGSASVQRKLSDDLSTKEWMDLRNSQVRKKRA